MMKLAMALVLTVALGLTAFGTTTDELKLTSGSSTVTITDNGSGDSNSADGTIVYSNANFNGWSISVTTGLSNSPETNPGLTVTSITATCNGTGPCSANSLDIQYSDQNFSSVNPAFLMSYSETITGNGSVGETGYFDNGNGLFAETGLIGSIGPLTSTASGLTATGGTGSVAPYSLTLDQVFTDNGSAVTFESGGQITGVPEPGAVVLFGTALLFCVTKLRKRRLS